MEKVFLVAKKVTYENCHINPFPTVKERVAARGKNIRFGGSVIPMLNRYGELFSLKKSTHTEYLFNTEWAKTGYTPYGAPPENPGFMRFHEDSTVCFESKELAQAVIDSLPKGTYSIKTLNKK